MLYRPLGLLALATTQLVQGRWLPNSKKIRTVVTTDMEQDDLTSLIRYILYTPDVDTQGIVYSASRFHWEGDYKGTTFYLPDREYDTPQTSWRWTGNSTIQDTVIPAYAQVYSNLIVHDPSYPSPEHLQSLTKLGNIDFEGEYDHDTEGSNLIKSLILDDDPRLLYLQAWGGTNTIARALRSIEEDHSSSRSWSQLKSHISHKVIIMASGFQDNTYDEYIAPTWPDLQVRSSGVYWTVYNCNVNGTGNLRGLQGNHIYFTGAWIHANIATGPYGRLYRSWLDGQHMAGDQLDVFGNTTADPVGASDWCQPQKRYDFLGEGDDGTYFPLLASGIQDPANPNLGGWGGRAARNASVAANLWENVVDERASNGSEVANYGTDRFIAAMQNDFAARMKWTLTGSYIEGNHAPEVRIKGGKVVGGGPGSNVTLRSRVTDPDGDRVTTAWWQYFEEGTYNRTVSISSKGDQAIVQVPADAERGQTISIILQGTDDGEFPLTRYDRVMIKVC